MSTASLLSSLSGLSNTSTVNSSSTQPLLSSLGIGSGLNVTAMISALMSEASQPLTQLQSTISSYNTQISDLGSLNSNLSSLQTAAQALQGPSAFDSFSATSSNTSVLSATASSSATQGTYNIVVGSVAQAQTLAVNNTEAASLTSTTAAVATGAGNLTFTVNGTTSSVAVASGASLQDISNDINSADVGVNASIVNSGTSATPAYKLVLTTASTGLSSQISKVAADSSTGLDFLNYNNGGSNELTQTQPASDATLTVNGVSVSSSTNNVSGAVQGLSLTVSQLGSSNVTVGLDSSTIDSNVQAFVSAYNQVVKESSNLYTGALQGDSTMTTVQNQLVSILQTPTSGTTGPYKYLTELGITLQTDGTLSLDSTKLNSALQTNVNNVAQVFTNTNNNGVMDRFNTQLLAMTGTSGLVSSDKQSIQSLLTSANANAANMQYNLGQQQTLLESEYSALDTSMASLQSSATYLTKALG